jgi:hypothetical protein
MPGRPIMKYSDIEKIQQAGLITAEQQQKIVEHFKLKEESNKPWRFSLSSARLSLFVELFSSSALIGTKSRVA